MECNASLKSNTKNCDKDIHGDDILYVSIQLGQKHCNIGKTELYAVNSDYTPN